MDDTEEIIAKRLEGFSRETLPVAEHYRAKGKLLDVDGLGEPEAVYARLRAALATLLPGL
jgi:adenylate kinase